MPMKNKEGQQDAISMFSKEVSLTILHGYLDDANPGRGQAQVASAPVTAGDVTVRASNANRNDAARRQARTPPSVLYGNQYAVLADDEADP